MRRIRNLPDNYDTEDEDAWGPGGLFPEREELEDYGEEAIRVKKVLDRAVRRLTREINEGSVNGSKRDHRKRKRKPETQPAPNEHQYGFTPRKRSRFNDDYPPSTRGRGRIRRGEPPEEGLDDLDLDLLGESREEEQLEAETEGESGGGGEDSGDELTEDEALDIA